jgi:hypothetical protein
LKPKCASRFPQEKLEGSAKSKLLSITSLADVHKIITKILYLTDVFLRKWQLMPCNQISEENQTQIQDCSI